MLRTSARSAVIQAEIELTDEMPVGALRRFLSLASSEDVPVRLVYTEYDEPSLVIRVA